jgi:heptosyltransferase-3
VKKQKYDCVINLTEGDKGNLLAIFSRSKFRVGQKDSRGESYLTHLYRNMPIQRHSVEKDLDALRRLGIYPDDCEKKLLIARGEAHQDNVKQFLSQKNIENFIVLHPVSRWMYKSPQSKTFINFIKKTKSQVVITGFDQGIEGEFIQKILSEYYLLRYYYLSFYLGRILGSIYYLHY